MLLHFKLLVVDIFYFLLFGIFRVFPIKKRKIVYDNFDGKGFGDNCKYIAFEIERRKLYYEQVWLVEKYDFDMPQHIKQVNKSSLRAIYELSTAHFWIDNVRKPFYIRKRKAQYYFQTWHGGVMIKMIERDVVEKLTTDYVKNAIHDSSLIDFFISNSCFFTQKIETAFWYTGKILPIGAPRMDIIINNNLELKNRIKKQLNIESDTKVVMYAPTFRNNNNIDMYLLDSMSIVNALNEKFNGKWYFLYRLHPAINNLFSSENFVDGVLDVSYYSDMQELLLISDVLITDYSSIMFEFSSLYRPVFIYAKDFSEFLLERGVYFDISKLPFSFANNIEQLLNNIKMHDNQVFDKSVQRLLDNIGGFDDGHASERLVDMMEKIS